jgi:hypothetical protein
MNTENTTEQPAPIERDGAAGIPRAELIRLAAEVSAHRYTNRHLPGQPSHAFSIEQLEAFVTHVVARWLQERGQWVVNDATLASVRAEAAAAALAAHQPAVSEYSISALRWLLNLTTEFDRKDVRTRQAARLLDEYGSGEPFKTNREQLEELWRALTPQFKHWEREQAVVPARPGITPADGLPPLPRASHTDSDGFPAYGVSLVINYARNAQRMALAAQQPAIPPAVIAWRDAYGKYVAALDAYNSRVTAIREREKAMPHTFGEDNPHAEWDAWNKAEREARALVPAMYEALAAAPAVPAASTIPRELQERAAVEIAQIDQQDTERSARAGLQPCRCGAAPTLIDREHNQTPQLRGAWIECKACGMSTGIKATVAEAMQVWQPAASGEPAAQKEPTFMERQMLASLADIAEAVGIGEDGTGDPDEILSAIDDLKLAAAGPSSALADQIADTWPDCKYTLDEIAERIKAMGGPAGTTGEQA